MFVLQKSKSLRVWFRLTFSKDPAHLAYKHKNQIYSIQLPPLMPLTGLSSALSAWILYVISNYVALAGPSLQLPSFLVTVALWGRINHAFSTLKNTLLHATMTITVAMVGGCNRHNITYASMAQLLTPASSTNQAMAWQGCAQPSATMEANSHLPRLSVSAMYARTRRHLKREWLNMAQFKH